MTQQHQAEEKESNQDLITLSHNSRKDILHYLRQFKSIFNSLLDKNYICSNYSNSEIDYELVSPANLQSVKDVRDQIKDIEDYISLLRLYKFEYLENMRTLIFIIMKIYQQNIISHNDLQWNKDVADLDNWSKLINNILY